MATVNPCNTCTKYFEEASTLANGVKVGVCKRYPPSDENKEGFPQITNATTQGCGEWSV